MSENPLPNQDFTKGSLQIAKEFATWMLAQIEATKTPEEILVAHMGLSADDVLGAQEVIYTMADCQELEGDDREVMISSVSLLLGVWLEKRRVVLESAHAS